MSINPKYLRRLLVVAVAYFIAGRLGLATPFTSGNISPVWPAAGIALAAVLSYGHSIWPAIFVGAFFTNYFSPIPHIAAFGLATGNTLEASAGAFLLQRVVRFNPDLSRLRDVISLIAVAAVGSTLVGATIGVAVLFATQVSPWSNVGYAWFVYWLGDAMGILLLTPLLLTFTDFKTVWRQHRLPEMILLLTALVLTGFTVFHQQPWLVVKVDVLAFAVFPFVMWAAIRFGVAGCALSTLIVAMIATFATAHGYGPFAHYSAFADASLLQVFFGVLSISGLTLGAAIAERERLDRMRTAEAARLRLAAIVECSEDAIVGKDLNGIVSSWNAAAEKMFGYTSQEMIGNSIFTIIPDEVREQEFEFLARLQQGQTIDHLETKRMTKSGEIIDVSITISPVRDETGRVIGAAKIARNITEQQKTQAALLTSEKLASVGRMAATIAHEINNPLEAVMNLIYLARQSPGLPANVRELLETADEELLRVSYLARQTLGFYRETSAPSTSQVADVFRSILLVYGSKIATKNIQVRVDAPENLTVETVLGEFRQVVANLVLNSIEAVPLGGTIYLRASSATSIGAGTVRITIADNGPGIEQSDLAKIFDPFFTTKKDLGTGLGLWVCKGIVEKHGGALRVKSCTRPDRSWTAFSLLWPSGASADSSQPSRQSRHQKA